MYTLVRTLAVRLLISIIIFMPDSGTSCMDEKQIIQNNSSPLAEANFRLSVEMGSTTVLCCPDVLLTNVLLTTWKITLRGQPLCTKSYDKEENQTSDNCTDERITWAFRPDLSPHLQINGAAVTHDGIYICEMVNSTGNFQHEFQLQVLVRPEANIFLNKNKTVVCQAVAGKPAAQISWIPPGHCQKEETTSYSNRTVTVRSSCSYSGNVSTVTCLVSHLTGNWSLSESLSPEELYIHSKIERKVQKILIEALTSPGTTSPAVDNLTVVIFTTVTEPTCTHDPHTKSIVSISVMSW
ncbi:cell surface glycoprotein CD200 receptor 2-like [Cavia porcellus]|uniref:cell surface glycoprotein CD200 receptor 2-like n=1 Tax=Cavia porcellus TaxID=10141 RepID=UPI00022B521B|nr:cell surface glycoprotein CD200 receptor 2-like [Cavia porcellus]